ncbi:DUF1385 domain-containing protein [bacterium]|nr:DUF1385 domain-containing protein [bacterium]
MMRSPEKIAMAVRKPDGRIALKIKTFLSWTKKHKILGLPLIRGGVILLESMVEGIQALNFSGEIAIEEENKKQDPLKKEETSDWKNKLYLGFTIVLAFGLGLLIFFYVPLLLTELTGVESGLMFNLIDGLVRVVFFLGYLLMISRWKEIHRVFQYHGAEHKSIFTFESGDELTVANAAKYTTHHPRCGTSFLVVVMMVSVVVFLFLGKPYSIGTRLLRLAFVPVIGGISYEFIRLSAKVQNSAWVKPFIAPGLWTQRITTQEPDESQLEVALVALKGALSKPLPDNVDLV